MRCRGWKLSDHSNMTLRVNLMAHRHGKWFFFCFKIWWIFPKNNAGMELTSGREYCYPYMVSNCHWAVPALQSI